MSGSLNIIHKVQFVGKNQKKNALKISQDTAADFYIKLTVPFNTVNDTTYLTFY